MRPPTVELPVNVQLARFRKGIALATAVLVSACSSAAPAAPSSSAPAPPFVQATLDGAKWTSERVTISETPAQLPRPGILNIAGTGSFGRDSTANVVLHISPPPTAVGTYTTDDKDFRLTVAFFSSSGQPHSYHAGNLYSGTTGSLTLNSLTTTGASGTFSFTGVSTDSRTKTVSNGTFDVLF